MIHPLEKHVVVHGWGGPPGGHPAVYPRVFQFYEQKWVFRLLRLKANPARTV